MSLGRSRNDEDNERLASTPHGCSALVGVSDCIPTIRVGFMIFDRIIYALKFIYF